MPFAARVAFAPALIAVFIARIKPHGQWRRRRRLDGTSMYRGCVPVGRVVCGTCEPTSSSGKRK